MKDFVIFHQSTCVCLSFGLQLRQARVRPDRAARCCPSVRLSLPDSRTKSGSLQAHFAAIYPQPRYTSGTASVETLNGRTAPESPALYSGGRERGLSGVPHWATGVFLLSLLLRNQWLTPRARANHPFVQEHHRLRARACVCVCACVCVRACVCVISKAFSCKSTILIRKINK